MTTLAHSRPSFVHVLRPFFCSSGLGTDRRPYSAIGRSRAALSSRVSGLKLSRPDSTHPLQNATIAADDRHEAERRLRELVELHRDTAPRLADWLETNVPQGPTIFAVPAGHRKRLRTTNSLDA